MENDKRQYVCAMALSQLPKKFVIITAGISTLKKRPLMPVTCQRAFTLTAELLSKKKVYEAEHINHMGVALFFAIKKGHTFDQLLKNYTDDEAIMQDEDGQNALYVIYLNKVNEQLSKKLAIIDFPENDLLVMVMVMFPYCDKINRIKLGNFILTF